MQYTITVVKCETCKGTGKIRNGVECPDCYGKAERKIIRYYDSGDHNKQILEGKDREAQN